MRPGRIPLPAGICGEDFLSLARLNVMASRMRLSGLFKYPSIPTSKH